LVRAAVEHLNLEHTWISLNTSDFWDRLLDTSKNRDSPVLTLSSYAQEGLMQEVHAHEYRVVVGGLGADELFSGYYDHHLLYIASINANQRPTAIENWTREIKPIVRNPYLRDPLRFVNDPSFRDHIYLHAYKFNDLMMSPMPSTFSESHYGLSLLRERMLNELFHESVPVMLREEDQNAMRWSVENRSPFLDRNLVEFSCTIPDTLLIRGGAAKAVLREVGRGLAPSKVLDSRRKVGFNVPIRSLLDVRNPAARDQLLAPSVIWEIIDRSGFAALLEEGDMSNSMSKFVFAVASSKAFLDSLDGSAEG